MVHKLAEKQWEVWAQRRNSKKHWAQSGVQEVPSAHQKISGLGGCWSPGTGTQRLWCPLLGELQTHLGTSSGWPQSCLHPRPCCHSVKTQRQKMRHMRQGKKKKTNILNPKAHLGPLYWSSKSEGQLGLRETRIWGLMFFCPKGWPVSYQLIHCSQDRRNKLRFSKYSMETLSDSLRAPSQFYSA